MKALLSEKRTQVYFPMDLYRRMVKKARAESKSSAMIIREAVGQYLEREDKKEKEIDWKNDPFFKAVGFIKSDMTDMSVNLDHYLYGSKKVRQVKK